MEELLKVKSATINRESKIATFEIEEPKVLNLTLNKKWFDMIASGEKKEEYREIKDYWIKRFLHAFDFCIPPLDEFFQIVNREYVTTSGNTVFEAIKKHFDIVSANNGYQKNCPNVKWQHKGIRIGTGKEEWGAEPGKQYFILEIGEILSVTK